MKILFLSRWYPDPPSNGSKLRVYNLLTGIAKEHSISLISFVEPGEQPVGSGRLHQICESVQSIVRKPYKPTSQKALAGLLSSKPRSVVDTYSFLMQEAIENTLQNNPFDLVIASQFDMAIYRDSFRHLPAIFEEVEVGILHEQYANSSSVPMKLRYGLTWWKHRSYLKRLLSQYQLSTVVSEQEQSLIREHIDTSIDVVKIPNYIDLGDYSGTYPSADPDQIIFTGALTYQPNYEAMLWFAQDILPIVHTRLPGINVLVTGDHGGKKLSSDVRLHQVGYIADIKPLVAGSWAAMAPIKTGGGTRLKILEAMALGTPVISTSKGAQGLDASPGEHILIADTAKEFAQAVIDLCTDHNLRREISHNALKLVQSRYDASVVEPDFLRLIQKAGRNVSYETNQLA